MAKKNDNILLYAGLAVAGYFLYKNFAKISTGSPAVIPAPSGVVQLPAPQTALTVEPDPAAGYDYLSPVLGQSQIL